MIKWQESYATGVAKLDEQHKSLFEYCNELENGLNLGEASKLTLDRSLVFLERYVKGHFNQEETCMFKYACPIAEKNQAAHQKFIEVYKAYEKIISESAESDRDCENILRELHHFLENWLINHICKIDTQLKPCVPS